MLKTIADELMTVLAVVNDKIEQIFYVLSSSRHEAGLMLVLKSSTLMYMLLADHAKSSKWVGGLAQERVEGILDAEK